MSEGAGQLAPRASSALVRQALQRLREVATIEGDAWTFRAPRGIGTHEGSAGLVLCYAQLARRVADSRAAWRAAVRPWLSGLLWQCEATPPSLTPYPLGLASALDVCGRLAAELAWPQAQRRVTACARAALRAEASPSALREGDYLTGAAGLAVAASRLAARAHRAVPRPLARTIARALGAACELGPRGVVLRGVLGSAPLCGVSHGASGVILALTVCASPSPWRRALLQGLLAYERACGMEGGGWPDFRQRPASVELGWCHGSYGLRGVRRRLVAGDRGFADDAGCLEDLRAASLHLRTARGVGLTPRGGEVFAWRLRGAADAVLQRPACASAFARAIARDEPLQGAHDSAIAGLLVALGGGESLWWPPPAAARARWLDREHPLLWASFAHGALPELERLGGASRLLLALRRDPAAPLSAWPSSARRSPWLAHERLRLRHRHAAADALAVAERARHERGAGRALARLPWPLLAETALRLSPRCVAVRAPDGAEEWWLDQGHALDAWQLDTALSPLLAQAPRTAGARVAACGASSRAELGLRHLLAAGLLVESEAAASRPALAAVERFPADALD